MHLKVFYIIFIYELLFNMNHLTPEVTALNPKHTGEIKEVNVNYTLDGDIIQLLVNWTDTLSNETSYNVIVEPVNYTLCQYMPCSINGIRKPIDYLVLPENQMPHVEDKDCKYLFGCNYTLKVETSNAMIAKQTEIFIPDCIMGKCSCINAQKQPKMLTVANLPDNSTIIFNWSINLKDNNSKPLNDYLELTKLYLRISEEKNPSLRWGGRLSLLSENVFQIKNLSYSVRRNVLMGKINIEVEQQLSAKAVIHIDSFLVDNFDCAGPESFIRIQVPNFNQQDYFFTKNFIWLITVVVTSVVLTLFVFLFFIFHFKKVQKGPKKNENILPPFSGETFEMVDNVIYIDKYVEEAQFNGIADAFEVPHHSIHIGSEIGSGAFGCVYKATALNLRLMRGETIVAVKQLKKNSTPDEEKEFRSEIQMLKEVGRHNNIVCFLGCCTIKKPYLMIMEYVGRGDLLTYLYNIRHQGTKFKSKNANINNKQPIQTPDVKYIELKISSQTTQSIEGYSKKTPQKPSVSETTYSLFEDEEPFVYILDHRELHDFAMQIANGMRFLEEQEIVHRDLAARNVLIDNYKNLKISDFGLSRHGIYVNKKSRKLPLRWLSIEAIIDNTYTSKSDVWAYGVVLWEIGTLGASPYPTINSNELISFLKSGKRLEKPDICTEQFYKIMLQCWDEFPDNRPSFEEIYNTLKSKKSYVDINSLSDDYVFPPIIDKTHS